MSNKLSIAIIGAGLGGIGAAVTLRRAGLTNVTIFERSGGPGGTWFDNRYPGAACDIASHLYSYSFKLHDWSGTHGTQAEILEYLDEVIAEFGLASRFRFNTPVRSISWNDSSLAYDLVTEDGQRQEFNAVICALGQLNHPRYPDWPGLEEFRGPKFHTARWEHDHDLRDKRVAVVGTGSTAAQVVPAIAPDVGHLYLYQREPGWVVPKESRTYSSEERARLRSNLAKKLERSRIFLTNERRIGALKVESKAQARGRADCVAFIGSVIEDAELRAAVTPNYVFRCKRPVRSSDFYPALTRENVTLVPHAVERVTPTGIVDTTGTEREVDVLVMATGFQPTNFLATLEVYGRDGRSIHEAWADDPEAFLGITYPGFPNFFMLYGPNTNSSTTSLIFVLECQARYVAQTLRRMIKKGAAAVDTRPWVNERYNRWIQKGLVDSAYNGACNNYYRSPSGRIVTNWPYTAVLYWAMTRLFGASSAGLSFSR
jgi:cation diffusion facilitator CzcD-associated flavoprotein CzcO